MQGVPTRENAAFIGNVALRWGARTHAGHMRGQNEDAVFTAPGVFVVADGMGGQQGGEIASALAVAVFASAARDASAGRLSLAAVEELLTTANDEILVRARDANSLMGTTVVALLVVQNGGELSPVLVNVGDSRCYALIDGKLRRLTHDHSHVQELVDAGDLTEAEASSHPLRNVITRALGAEDLIAADYVILEERSARLLLCSDGLSGELDDEVLANELSSEGGPQVVADRLVDAVLAGTARDNVSAIVVDLEVRPAQPDSMHTDERAADATMLLSRQPMTLQTHHEGAR